MYNLQLLCKSLSDGNRYIRIVHRNELPDTVRKQRPGTSPGRMAGRRSWKKTGWWMCEMWKMRRSLSAAYQDQGRTWESSKRIARLESYEYANKRIPRRHALATSHWQRYISDQNTVAKYRPCSSTFLGIVYFAHCKSFRLARGHLSGEIFRAKCVCPFGWHIAKV